MRDLMQYMRRRWCSQWIVCKWSCPRKHVVSSRVFEMGLFEGYVGWVRREVRLLIVDVWGVPMRLMTMERTSTSVLGQ
jgi:hypothetical protein